MNHPVIAPLAPLLPSMDAAAAARARVLCSHPLEQALSAWVPGLKVLPAVEGSPTASSVSGSDAYFGILLHGPRMSVDLLVPVSIDAVCAAIVSASAWSQTVQLRCWMQRIKSCLAPLLLGLEQLGLRVACLAARPEQLPPGPRESLFKCQVNGQRIHARLCCDDLDSLLALETALQRANPVRLDTTSSWLLPLRLRLGTRRLALGLLNALQVGDVLLLDQGTEGDSSHQAAWLVLGDLRARGTVARTCSVNHRTITIQGDQWMNTQALFENTSSTEVSEASSDESVRSALSPMAQVEVDLHLELHVMSAPLAELAAMRPGYVLELPMPASEVRVSMVVGGQVVGRAEMVCVGERLGARILEVFHDSP